jgi:predicted lipoprotein with Yx(FWY)xxD motif
VTIIACTAVATGAMAEPPAAANIVLKEQGHGWVLTDSQGMTLYTYARDVQPGTSNCIEECASTWPPLLADESAANSPDWTVIDRQDATKQWAYRDKPLYRYSVDQSPDDTYGEGVRALWSIALVPLATPPGIKIQKTLQGYVAANNDRKTLYAPQGDIDPKTLCIDDACGTDWRPVVAPWAARDLDNWTVVDRNDGLRQWAYKNQPLFSYAGDVQPREYNGDGVAFAADESWKSVIMQPRIPYPSWVTVHNTDAGAMLADSNGKTIYTYDPSRIPFYLRGLQDTCGVECLDEEWIPILASAEDTTAGGNWAILPLGEGSRQWAYKGRRVFTNVRDKTQGSFLGYRHGGNRYWGVIMDSEDALVGTLRPP